jgi:hypothetical protein
VPPSAESNFAQHPFGSPFQPSLKYCYRREGVGGFELNRLGWCAQLQLTEIQCPPVRQVHLARIGIASNSFPRPTAWQSASGEKLRVRISSHPAGKSRSYGSISRRQRCQHSLRPDRKMTDARTRGGEDGISNRRRNRRGRWFTKPYRCFRTWQELHLDVRYVSHAQQCITCLGLYPWVGLSRTLIPR